MGLDIFVTIASQIECWNDGHKEQLKLICKNHLEKLEPIETFEKNIAHNFLTDILNNKCIHSSTKGDGLSWAAGERYVSIKELCNELLPFIVDLYISRILPSYSGFIITISADGSEKTEVAEIKLPTSIKHILHQGGIIRTDNVSVSIYTHSWFITI